MNNLLLKALQHNYQSFVYQIFRVNPVVVLLLVLTLVGCSSLSFQSTKKALKEKLQTDAFEAQHTGLYVVDLDQNKTVINTNGTKFFIPASTTKLFTFYSSLKLLNDTLPAFKYHIDDKTLIGLGTGDPTWLHPYFNNEGPIAFLQRFDSIQLYLDNYDGEKFGPGWAWEDYAYYFSPEITALPLHGNVVTIEVNDALKVTPNYFFKEVFEENSRPLRDWKKNVFYIHPKTRDTLQIPYITSNKLTQKLLSEQLQKTVELLDSLPKKEWNVLPGILKDSVLKRMLWESDNFLAEQLMLLCSSTLSDTLSFTKTKDFMLTEYLNDLKQEPRWVDGSGLSRYNLFTPQTMVHLLQKMYAEIDSTRLFSLMPRWDANGTLSEKEITPEHTHIYGKSGSMGNIYTLCGYLRTKSGKLLAFSFMNNQFRRPSREVRKDMYDILTSIRLSY